MDRRSHDLGPESDRAIGARVASPPAPAPPARSLAWASAVGNQAVQRLARQILAREEMTPQKVLETYQVKEDTTEEWSPKLGGLIPIPFASGRELTVTEGKLLDDLTFSRGLVGLSDFKDIATSAFAVSEKEFPDPAAVPSWVPAGREREWKGNDGHRDALRHCFWNARLTKEYGFKWTEQFTTAHEALPQNSAQREAMDLFNNEVGRKIARDNPKATVAELAALVRKAVDGGKLIVIDRSGNLAWSNTVALWDHGLAGDDTLEGRIPVPAGDASVD